MNVIVMSTYNGSQYLPKQLDSVLQQTLKDFILLIRDDGSTDGTLELLETYHDPRIRLIKGDNLGPSGSFFALLKESRALNADYVFFCDQDDIWMPNKLELQIAEIKTVSPGPALVFSDFSMIDGDDRITGDSYTDMAKLRIPDDGNFFPKLLAQPYVFGCASVMNKELLNLVVDAPAGIEMYDCWISLVASLLGTVRYMATPTLHHRFHSSNATGRSGMNSISARFRRISKQLRQQCDNTSLRLRQTQLLLDRYDDALSDESRRQLQEIAIAGCGGGFDAIRVLKKHRISRGGHLQNAFFYVTAFMSKGEK